jgi:hypothetical protein
VKEAPLKTDVGEKVIINASPRNRKETWTGLIWLRTGHVAGSCERGNDFRDL